MERGEGVQHGTHDEAIPPKKIFRGQGWVMAPQRLTEACHHGLEFVGEEFLQKRQGLHEAAAQQPGGIPARRSGIPKQTEEGLGQYLEEDLDRHGTITGFSFCLGQPSQAGFVDGLDTSADNLQVK